MNSIQKTLITKNINIHFAENNLEVEKITDIHKFLEKKKQIEINGNFIKFKNFCGYLEDKLIIQKKLAKHFNLLDENENINTDYKKLYNEKFQKFLEEILNELSKENIIYHLSLSKISVKENSVNESKIFKLLLLMEFEEELINSLQLIRLNPHKKLFEYKSYKNLDEVNYIDSDIIVDILQSPDKLYQCANGIIEHNKTKYYPIKILQYEAEETFDTLENRFIKYFLKEIKTILDELKEFLFLRKLKNIKNEIEYLLQSEIFLEVKDLNYFPSNSQVLMKKSGYREIFKIYRLLHTSFIPEFFKNLDIAFSLKDMATLWEYYALVKILQKLKEKCGNYKTEINFEEKKKWTTIYEIAQFRFNKLILYYQKTFKSYSTLELRPDFYIEYNNKKFIFDAKFRIFEDNKTDILKNMHYYKDSLKVDFAVALCLGNEKGEFWKIDGNMQNLNSFIDFINKETLKGVGYINFEI